MNNRDSLISWRYASRLRLVTNYRYTGLFLTILTVNIAWHMVLQAKPILAQITVAQFSALDKNIIYVNPQLGDDSQVGEKLTPVKTITKALEIATSGTTIKLASGTYSEESGETFPLIIKKNITLKGNTENQGAKTIISGSGNFTSPTGAGQNVAIAALRDTAGVIGITVTNNHSRGHGLWVESASPNIAANTFTRNGNTGLSLNGKSSPVVENNYFYNNSGNGLLIYGTSQPEIIKNTFEQTGFGVSVVQNAAPALISNTFDGNRIGIILEGNSQGILRDNEIINSEEFGLTAISQSRVDLGTSSEPGKNIFRSNKKLDIQNATNHEIVAVGTEVQGNIDGRINFSGGEFVTASNTNNTQSSLPPLPESSKSTQPALPPLLESSKSTETRPNIPAPETPKIDTTANLNLPAPPPVMEKSIGNKELVFTASDSSSSDSAPIKTEPVPFPPSVNPSALGANTSQVASLSDVLGSSSQIKYKVLVEALNIVEESEVKAIYPQAFKTFFEGQSLLQIGAFNSWDKAKQAEETLIDLGLETFVLE